MHAPILSVPVGIVRVRDAKKWSGHCFEARFKSTDSHVTVDTRSKQTNWTCGIENELLTDIMFPLRF